MYRRNKKPQRLTKKSPKNKSNRSTPRNKFAKKKKVRIVDRNKKKKQITPAKQI
jgi:hypothetical protein